MIRKLRPLTVGLLLALMLLPLAAVTAQGGATISCDSEAPGIIDNDFFFNEWTLALKSAQAVTLTATATTGDLDTYLVLRSFEGVTLAENDDGPSMGYDSQISQTLEAGRYSVEVTRFGQQTGPSSGEYVLTVSCSAPGEVVTQPNVEPGEGVLFADDFSDESGGWWLGETENGEVWIADGELHVLNYTAATYTADTEPGLDLTDFSLSVDARLVGGTMDNWHYVTFRSASPGNYYRVGFSADGYYMGDVIRDGSRAEEWASATPTSAITQGVGAVNTARVEVAGDSVRFYVNDVLLIDTIVSASNAIPSGDIGLAVASMDGADYSEVAWDNLVVTGPGGAAVSAGLVGDVLFADDFSTDTGAWWLVSDERGEITIQNGELVIRDYFDDIAFSTGPVDLFEDVVVEVDSRLISGTENNWHFVVLRYSEDGKTSHYYRVGYSADGYYTGAEFHGGERTDWVEPTQTSAIIQGAATNHLRVELVGTHVIFSINGQVVLDTFAVQPLPAGEIWLSADALEASETVVAWDNFVVTAP